MSNVCRAMNQNEVLNRDMNNYPLYTSIIYGDKIDSTKLSKRLSCAIKHLPIRLLFLFEYDTKKAIEAGVRVSPTLVVDGTIFLEGLVQAEIITTAFKKLLENEFNIEDTKCNK